jgi:hypothetical protein
MGVMICNRHGCDNILCNRIILDNSMYICPDCYEELLEYRKSWPDTIMLYDIREYISEFMNTHKGKFKPLPSPQDIDEEFKRLTGD